MIRLSKLICEDPVIKKKYWFYHFSQGSLVTLWMDQILRRKNLEFGIQNVTTNLLKYMKENPEGFNENDFGNLLNRYSMHNFTEIYNRYIIGNDILPLNDILFGIGILRNGTNFRILPDNLLPENVVNFRKKVFK
jgi:predicted metalloprotease with PDZ domain